MPALRQFATAYAFAFTLLGCAASDHADYPWNSGKADGGPEVRELGPLEPGVTHELRADGFVPALRVESFGGTRIALSAQGSAPFLAVESLDGSEVGRSSDGKLTVTLPDAGVYRVLAWSEAGELTLTSSCEANCARPQISHLDFARSLGNNEQLFAVADARIEELIADPEQRAQLRAQLAAIRANPTLDGLERFPTVGIQTIGSIRPALGLIEAPAPQPDAVVNGELGELLGACAPSYSYPSPVNANLPGILYGHWPNRALTDCQTSHSAALAQVLTSLAANNGSSVTYAGATHTTPHSLIGALLDTGHTIELRNERTYANFISLTTADAEIRWPVWLDTGLVMSDGTTLAIPMGHSHHAWRISGPVVNARVMFYLGMFGAGFFAQTDIRPPWTGMRVHERSTDRDHILTSFDLAGQYLRRIHLERSTVAAGMPADGYGYLGVCNDSNAFMEYMTRGTITTYPLLRAAQLDQTEGADGLTPGFAALPHDADVAAPRADVLRRVLLMTPHALGSSLFPDDRLRGHLGEAAAELGQ